MTTKYEPANIFATKQAAIDWMSQQGLDNLYEIVEYDYKSESDYKYAVAYFNEDCSFNKYL